MYLLYEPIKSKLWFKISVDTYRIARDTSVSERPRRDVPRCIE
ncbi:hypothetical protein KSS87_021010 [Heliosperma pusillum]|nr:hypothetical protein KSS87_021010 [Heliosperma pusillum]